MSHQDTDDSTTNAEEVQAALDWLVPQQVLQDIQFQEGSTWSPRSLIFVTLMWSWSAKQALTKRFAEACKVQGFQKAEDEQPGKSYNGFLKRLRHWSGQLLKCVVVEFQRAMREELAEGFLVGGWLLLAGDGSRVATPRTRSNEQKFAAKKKRRRGKKAQTPHQKRLEKAKRRKKKRQTQADRDKKASTPQIWLTMLYHVGLGLPWDWRSGASDSSERAHLLDMAQDLPEQALVTLDAGFVGYEFWKTLDQSGTSFVARVGANVRLLKNLGYIRRSQDIVYVWPTKAQRKQEPPLALRLHGFCGGKEEVYLVTNVLDPKQLSSSTMREVYQARWGVEVYYRDFKQTFGRSKLLSKRADNTQLELDWSIVGMWAMCLYASAQHAANGVSPKRRSLANVLHAFRQTIEQFRSVAVEEEDLLSLIMVAIKDSYQRQSSKASRSHPRKNTKRAIGKPTIQEATKEQQSAAENIKTAL